MANTQPTGSVAITDPNNATYQAAITVMGEIRVEPQSTRVFLDAFDTGLNTTFLWKAPTAAGGGVAATNVPTSTQLGTGTTANGYSYLESIVAFPPCNPGWLDVFMGNNLPFPYVANTYFFFGTGTSPATPTAAIPITDGAGFEVAIGGKMYAVMYQGGARTFAQDLSAATGSAKQPVDANAHYYRMLYRGDQTNWYIDGVIVAQTFTGAPGPNVNTLPLKLAAIGGTSAPASSALLTCNVAVVADTTGSNNTLSDPLYPWQKQRVTNNGAAVTTNYGGVKATYTYAISATAPYATPTDWIVIRGSATKTVKIQRVEISGAATAATEVLLALNKHTVANTVGTSTTPTPMQHDSADGAATAVVLLYSVAPTINGSAAFWKVVRMTLAVAPSATAVNPDRYVYSYASEPYEPLTLHGVAQEFAINFAGAAVPTGGVYDIAISWSEE
jgi:hypothetical protein